MKRFFYCIIVLLLGIVTMATANVGKDVIVNGINLSNKDTELTFVEVETRYETNDGYGVYDVYKDGDSAVYRFLHGTDLLCGVYNRGFKSDSVLVFKPDSELIDIGNKYMENIFGKHHDYTFSHIGDYNDLNFRGIAYTYMINGIPTDDKVVIWISGEGDVISLVAYNRDRYADVSIFKRASVAKNYKKITNEVRDSYVEAVINGTNYDVRDEYISKNQEGDLVYVLEVEDLSPQYIKIERIEIPI